MYETSNNDLHFFNDDDNQNSTAKELGGFALHVRVLVKYCTKKTIKYYSGQITEMCTDTHECVDKFLHFNKLNNTFFWPMTEDFDTIEHESIEMFLPNPIEYRRGNFSGLNI